MEKLVKGDQVIVTTGKDRGKQGVIQSRETDGRFIVEGINIAKKHTKPNPAIGQQGGVLDKAMPIQASNLMLVNPATGKGEKVGFKVLDDGRKVRFFKSNGEVVSA